MASLDIPAGTLERLLERDGVQLRKHVVGQRVGACPFCNGGDDRFVLFSEEGRYWCRVCGLKGDAAAYLMKARRMTFPEAKAALNVSDTYVMQRARAQQRIQQQLGVVPKAAPKVSPESRANFERRRGGLVPMGGTPAAAYLAGRGIPEEIAVAAGVQYSPDFYRCEQEEGVWVDRPAVVFQIVDRAGAVVALQGRHIDGLEPRMHDAGPKGQGIFSTFDVKQPWPTRLAVTEAPIDALSLAAAGLPAVALVGTYAPDWLRRKLFGRTVMLATDADEPKTLPDGRVVQPGDDAAERLAAEFTQMGATCRRLRPEGAKDWNAYLMAYGLPALEQACSTGAAAPPPPLPEVGDRRSGVRHSQYEAQRLLAYAYRRWPERAAEWAGLDWRDPLAVATVVLGCVVTRVEPVVSDDERLELAA